MSGLSSGITLEEKFKMYSKSSQKKSGGGDRSAMGVNVFNQYSVLG